MVDYANVLADFVERRIRFAVAGGFACLAHGVVRVTMDLDLVVDVEDDNLARLWESLSALGFFPQQPISRSQATSAASLRQLSREKNMEALSWAHESQPFMIVDLLIGEAFRWSPELFEPVSLFGVSVPVVRSEELIRLKMRAGREKDLIDVRELERLRGSQS
jgi:hypothetical protein